MRTFSKLIAAAAATITAFGPSVPAATAYGVFSRYLDDAPDFTVEQAFQYDQSGTYFVRVCNNGSTPTAGGSLRVSVGRSANDRQDQYFSGIMPAGGSCSNFELPNIRSYGTTSTRTYPLTVWISWSGFQSELSTANNTKVIPVSTSARTTGSWNSSVATSWSNVPAVTKTSTNPTRDLFADWNPKNPYSGRTWYYPSTSVCYNQQYYDGYGYRYADNYNAYYNGYRPYNGYYYDSTGCNGNYPYAPGTSGYYWPGVSTNNQYYNNGYQTYYNGNNGNQTYYYNGQTYYYNGYQYYSPTADAYFQYLPTNATQTVSYGSLPNFTVARIGQDGTYNNVLVTICNNGADMSDFKDVTTEVRNTSQNTSFRATQYVRLLSGQCRDVSVPFSSFNLNFGGWYTFRATVDSDNKIMEQNESDNAFETNVQITKIQY